MVLKATCFLLLLHFLHVFIPCDKNITVFLLNQVVKPYAWFPSFLVQFQFRNKPI